MVVVGRLVKDVVGVDVVEGGVGVRDVQLHLAGLDDLHEVVLVAAAGVAQLVVQAWSGQGVWLIGRCKNYRRFGEEGETLALSGRLGKIRVSL